MPSNITLMREKKEKLLLKQKAIRTEAKGIARAIPVIINPTLSEIEDMEITRAATMIEDLMMKQGELLSIKTKLWDLEEALGI